VWSATTLKARLEVWVHNDASGMTHSQTSSSLWRDAGRDFHFLIRDISGSDGYCDWRLVFECWCQ
jgi:hypothetical protein